MAQPNYQGISPTDPSTWDENTKSLDVLYSVDGNPLDDAIDSRIEAYFILHPIPPGTVLFLSALIPDNTWDDVDTAGVGQEFAAGSYVQNTVTDVLYRCLDATTNAADWTIIVQERI